MTTTKRRVCRRRQGKSIRKLDEKKTIYWLKANGAAAAAVATTATLE